MGYLLEQQTARPTTDGVVELANALRPCDDRALEAQARAALALLHQQGIPVCLLRGADELVETLRAGDLDLLVRPGDLPALTACLRMAGWLVWQPAGHAPHRFFVRYEPSQDCWLKLDVVDRLAFGRPVKAIVTDLAERCWPRCMPADAALTLAPEDELVVLLLHCLLDKGAVAERHRRRLRWLCTAVRDRARLEELLRISGFQGLDAQRLSALLAADDDKALLAYQSQVRRRLAGRWGLAARLRALRLRLSRVWERWSGRARRRGLIVALMAPDGAGKTTLAQLLVERCWLPTRTLYLGRNPAAGGVRLPTTAWIERHRAGPWRWLARLARFPNTLLEQWYRYAVCARWARRGQVVVLDRHPYDDLLQTSRRALKSRLRRRLLHWGAPQPDLVVLLDAPGDVLYARKGEHDPAILEAQRQGYLALRSFMPQMVTVDATQALEQVYRAVMTEIWQAYWRREVQA